MTNPSRLMVALAVCALVCASLASAQESRPLQRIAVNGGELEYEVSGTGDPVLLIHGLDDQYLLPGALNDTWKHVEKDLTLVTIPKAGHFVHRDAPQLVNKTLVRWLTQE